MNPIKRLRQELDCLDLSSPKASFIIYNQDFNKAATASVNIN
jgi:hypothetical protein